MTGELRLAEVTTVKDGLLDSQVRPDTETLNGALQSQWQVIRDGMSAGAGHRLQEAKDNSLLTGVEIAGSFGLGAGMAYAIKAGGRWATAAEAGGAVMLGLMGFDLTRRGQAINEVYKGTSADSVMGQQMRRDAIANYAGGALVDYSLMFAAGGLGVASVHYGPKLANRFSTGMEKLGSYGQYSALEPALQPARASNFRLMDLGESGRLGAVEIAKANDPVSAVRERLDFPHRSVGLDQLQALVEAKQIAAHPQVRPIYEQMAETLSKVDTLKPLLSRDESALAALNKQLTEVKTLKPELQAVRTAESSLNGLKADMERVPLLREEQSNLTRQIQEAKAASKDAPESAKKSGKEEASINSEELRVRRREVSDTISNIQGRAQELPRLEQRFAEAKDNFSRRKDAIEAGTDAEVLALQSQMRPLQEAVSAKQAELAALTEQLKGLDLQYKSKADEIRPSLASLDSSALPSVPKYSRPKLDMPAPPATPKKVVERVKPAEVKAPELKQAADTTVPGKAGERTGTQKLEPQQKRLEQTVRTDRPVNEADVTKAFSEAKQAVDDFAATHKRHTTALKKVNDYIEKSFSWFASDQAAAANANKVAANVDSLLAKLENWDRSPGWIRQSDRAQLMQRNGLDALAMERFDKWYQSQNKNFHDSKGMMPDRRLVEIQQHLSRRVAVESVKNWLRTAPDVQSAVSPIVQSGFDIVASGKLPDGRAIPKGSDMIVFEKRTVNGQETVLPFAKDGQHMQRFDDVKISSGLQKLEAMNKKGPEGLKTEDLYGFRLDHDPSRLMASGEQVGFAILRPGGQYGKNILYMDFAATLDQALIPRNLKADSQQGAGTNTGVLYNMLRSNKKQ